MFYGPEVIFTSACAFWRVTTSISKTCCSGAGSSVLLDRSESDRPPEAGVVLLHPAKSVFGLTLGIGITDDEDIAFDTKQLNGVGAFNIGVDVGHVVPE
jgi:hypothetical protein